MNSRAEKCDKECLGSDGREAGMKEGMDGAMGRPTSFPDPTPMLQKCSSLIKMLLKES